MEPGSHACLRRALDRLEHDRLRSIEADARFVDLVARAAKLPLFANMRAGAWYCRRPDALCYFKSTDGHAGQHHFSLRRLNLNVLTAVLERGGVLIVDSTTKGKTLPDALSKTAAIWACLVSRALGQPTELCLAPTIPASERHQIEGKLCQWEQQLNQARLLEPFAGRLHKPIRPLWIHADSLFWEDPAPDYTQLDFHPLVCLSASSPTGCPPCVDPSWLDGTWRYVQGAGDDQEGWAGGLTAAAWWGWPEELWEEPAVRLGESRLWVGQTAGVDLAAERIAGVVWCGGEPSGLPEQVSAAWARCQLWSGAGAAGDFARQAVHRGCPSQGRAG